MHQTTIAFPSARGQPLLRDGVDFLLRRAVSRAARSCPSLNTKRVSPQGCSTLLIDGQAEQIIDPSESNPVAVLAESVGLVDA
jgi:hypothetical protein